MSKLTSLTHDGGWNLPLDELPAFVDAAPRSTAVFDSSWPDTQVAILGQLWNQRLSAAEIGRRLGGTKNAIVGKAHRLGLEPRPSPIGNGGAAYPRRPSLNGPRDRTIPPLLSEQMREIEDRGGYVTALELVDMLTAKGVTISPAQAAGRLRVWHGQHPPLQAPPPKPPSPKRAGRSPKPLRDFDHRNIADRPKVTLEALASVVAPLPPEITTAPLTPSPAPAMGTFSLRTCQEVTSDTGQWGDGLEAYQSRFCGHPAAPGVSYCAAHCAKNYLRMPRRPHQEAA